MKRSSAGDRTQREDAQTRVRNESRIDQALADSFPASDAPPWTLGVNPTPSNGVVTQKNDDDKSMGR